jgi:hypothetical protein
VYKGKDRKTIPLFKELFPFGGKLDENNRWLRIAELIPWDELEKEYRRYFSDIGRPALDSRLVIGLFLLKHMTGLSDREVVLALLENPYWQIFCGFEHFVRENILDPSSLTKLRKRLGVKYFKRLEEKTYRALIDLRIIKGKGLLVDATVFPENVKYPNDVGLMNDVREWLVDTIKTTGKKIGKSYRTYCRKARRAYLNFAKKKTKTKKVVKQAKRQMLQFVRRNLKQLEEAIITLIETNRGISQVVIERLKIAKTIYVQQMRMYKQNVHTIKDRIVSFHRPYVRPIKRGKEGGKKVEFGPKGSLSHVDGFLFLDKLDHDNYSEASTDVVREQIENYRAKFGKKPPSFTADKLYGSRNNRDLMDGEEIRGAFKPLGRKRKQTPSVDRWLRQKQKERNRIEGHFGNGKSHYNLDRILYQGVEGAEMWIRAGILGMNLKTAMARM